MRVRHIDEPEAKPKVSGPRSHQGPWHLTARPGALALSLLPHTHNPLPLLDDKKSQNEKPCTVWQLC